MNGAGPPDRVSRWLYRRCRDGPEHIYLAESSHAKVLKKNNRHEAPVVARHQVARPYSDARN